MRRRARDADAPQASHRAMLSLDRFMTRPSFVPLRKQPNGNPISPLESRKERAWGTFPAFAPETRRFPKQDSEALRQTGANHVFAPEQLVLAYRRSLEMNRLATVVHRDVANSRLFRSIRRSEPSTYLGNTRLHISRPSNILLHRYLREGASLRRALIHRKQL